MAKNMRLSDFRGCLFCCDRYPGRCFEVIGGWSREYAFCYDPEEDAIARMPWDEEVEQLP